MPTFNYPTLRSIVPVNKFTTNLLTIKQFTDFLDHIYIKTHQTTNSSNFNANSSRLLLSTSKQLGFEIPGTGLEVALNYSVTGTSPTSDFWVNYHLKKGALALLDAPNISNFSADPIAYFELILNYLGLDADALIEAIIVRGITGGLSQFVTDINTKYTAIVQAPNSYTPLAIPNSTDPIEVQIENLLLSIESNTYFSNNEIELFEIINETYLSGNTINNGLTFLRDVFSVYFKDDVLDTIKDLLIPELNISVDDINVAIIFPRNLLIPVDSNNNPLPEPNKSTLTFDLGRLRFSTKDGLDFKNIDSASINIAKSEILGTGIILEINGIKLDLSKKRNIPEAIADGRPNDFIGVYVHDAKVSLPAKWFKDSTVVGEKLPNGEAIPSLKPEILCSNLLIGTGGISGTIAFDNSGHTLYKKIGNGNFWIGLDKFSMTFQQNSITATDISGKMFIKGLETEVEDTSVSPQTSPPTTKIVGAEIGITLHIEPDGDFKLTASANPPQKFIIKDVLEIRVESLSIGRETDSSNDHRWYVMVSGGIKITVKKDSTKSTSTTEIDIPKLEIKNLRIWDDGEMEFVGGGITLPVSFKLEVGPAKLNISNIGFGSHKKLFNGKERHYNYFGFDGALGVHPGGVDVRGNGVQLHFSKPDTNNTKPDIYVTIAGIAVDLVFPGNAEEKDAKVVIKGYLSMKTPENPALTVDDLKKVQTEYAGGVTFKLNDLNISGKAAMRLMPKVPAFLVDVELEIPTPITLGPTGLGVYGFRGLIGDHYVPQKTNAEDSWWEYYKEKKAPPNNKEGINVDKFAQKDGFSLGVGASVGTISDNGYSFSSKLFVLLGLPDVLLLQGQANFLHKRLGIDDPQDPPYFAMLALSKEKVEAALGVTYKLPNDEDGADKVGKILSVEGVLESGFYFHDPSAWYINVGRDLPESKRVRARLVNLFDAYAFIMLSAQGFKAGAGLSYEMNKTYLKKVKVDAGFELDVLGQISFKPKQLGGSIALAGHLGAHVFGFGFGFSISAGLSAESPKPKMVDGYFTLNIDVPRPFKDISFKIELSWVDKEEIDSVAIQLLDPAKLADPKKVPFKAISMLSGEAFSLQSGDNTSNAINSLNPTTSTKWNNSNTIPLDSFIDIQLDRPVNPDNANDKILRLGSQPIFTELVPPIPSKHAQVLHSYSVEDIQIKYWNEAGTGNWADFDIYLAAQSIFTGLGMTASHSSDMYPSGYWQINSTPGKYNALRIMATDPFSVISGGSNSSGGKTTTPESLGHKSSNLLCDETQIIITKQCQNWDAISLPQSYPKDTPTPILDRKLMLRFLKKEGELEYIYSQLLGGTNTAIEISAGGNLEIHFLQPAVFINLYMSSLNNFVVEYYTKSQNAIADANGIKNYTWGKVDERMYELGADEFGNQLLMAPITYDNENMPIGKIVIITDGRCSIRDTNISINPTTDFSRPEYDVDENTDGATIFSNLDSPLLNTDDYSLSPYDSPNEDPFNPCAIYLHQVCWSTIEQKVIYNAQNTANNKTNTQAKITSTVSKMIDAKNKVLQPIWRPDTYYAITLKVKDTVNVNGLSTDGAIQELYVAFKTAGPVGFFHQQDDNFNTLLALDKEDEYKLARLKHYIDYQHSFPNADGALVNAKPLYYGYQSPNSPELSLFFINNYIPEFYAKWPEYGTGAGNSREYKLVPKIIDPVDNKENQSITNIASKWEVKKYDPTKPLDLPNAVDMPSAKIIENLLSVPNCTGKTGPIIPPHAKFSVTPQGLKPLKLYTVVFYAQKYKQDGITIDDMEIQVAGSPQTVDASVEVHKYPFQTSRYKDFVEHVNSYILKPADTLNSIPAKKAIFNFVALDDTSSVLTSKLALIKDVINETIAFTDNLIRDYALKYDRIITGILKMKALQAALTTEFTVLTYHDINSSPMDFDVLALLIRTPEPFNDPKFNENATQKSIILKNSAGTDLNAKIVFSKDKTSIFVTLISGNVVGIPYGNYSIEFNYFQYDGSSYKADASNTTAVSLSLTI